MRMVRGDERRLCRRRRVAGKTAKDRRGNILASRDDAEVRIRRTQPEPQPHVGLHGILDGLSLHPDRHPLLDRTFHARRIEDDLHAARLAAPKHAGPYIDLQAGAVTRHAQDMPLTPVVVGDRERTVDRAVLVDDPEIDPVLRRRNDLRALADAHDRRLPRLDGTGKQARKNYDQRNSHGSTKLHKLIIAQPARNMCSNCYTFGKFFLRLLGDPNCGPRA